MTAAFVFYSCCLFRKQREIGKKPFVGSTCPTSTTKSTSVVTYRETRSRTRYLCAQLEERLEENLEAFKLELHSRNPSEYPIRAPEWFIRQRNERNKDYVLKPGEIAVRFINTPTGKDIVVAAKPTENLMEVADSVGLKIPRFCETGVCGTCTAELEDLSSVDGRVAIRPCCTDVYLPTGCDEMVVDVFHCRNRSSVFDLEEEVLQSEKRFMRECSTCLGQGTVVCSPCDGTGILQQNETEELCCYCMGRKISLCADCQGKGLVKTEF